MSMSTEANSFFRAPLLAVTLIGAGAVLLYGHKLQAPFYLDAFGATQENYRLRDLSACFAHLFPIRGLMNQSFSINHRLIWLPLPLLHRAKLLLYAVCGIFVWLLLRRLFRGDWLPICGVLLLIAHPLQAHGVPCLVQGATVLGAFAFMLVFLLPQHARAAISFSAGQTGRSVADTESLSLYASLGWRLADQGEVEDESKRNGDFSCAIGYPLRGLAVEGAGNVRLLNPLGVIGSDYGARKEAEQALLASLSWAMGKGHAAVVWLNLVWEYYLQQRWSEDLTALQTVERLVPVDGVAMERLGEVSLRFGNLSVARQAEAKLKHIDPDVWQRLQGVLGREFQR